MSSENSISFVLPMYNEQDNIVNTVSAIKSLATELADDYEIVIVDDASTDKSGKIIDELASKDGSVRAFHMGENTKFGGAFAKAFKEAKKEIILYLDSDMPVSAEDIKDSFSMIKEADIVTGYSRVKKGDTLKRKIISSVYNFLVQVLFGLNIKDINSGYKIVRKDIVKDLDFISKSPFIDVELFLHAKKKNGRVRQYPLVFHQRKGGKSYIARLPVVWATFVDMIKVRVLAPRKI
ncbi:MAG: glycosyltransferase family 2 protein [Candidatus Omnitrophota bacterium]|jgi:glycosyltransferase involved in cell wall biosynthesis